MLQTAVHNFALLFVFICTVVAFVSRGGVSGYSLLLLPSPPTLSRIMDHKTARTRACAEGG